MKPSPKRTWRPLIAILLLAIVAILAVLVRSVLPTGDSRVTKPTNPPHSQHPSPAATLSASARSTLPSLSQPLTNQLPSRPANATPTEQTLRAAAPAGSQDAVRVLVLPGNQPNLDYTNAYTRQVRAIALDAGVLRGAGGLPKGSRLALNLFPDATYTTVVEKAVFDINDALTITGRLPGHRLQTFTLSEKDGIVLADLLDMNTGRMFKIAYTATNSQHLAIEYIPTHMPASYDLHK